MPQHPIMFGGFNRMSAHGDTPPADLFPSGLACAELCRAQIHRAAWYADHSRRVARLAMLLGRLCGLDDARNQALGRAASVHDVGKLALPDAIIFGAGALSAAEYDLIKTHTEIGCRILAEDPADRDGFAADMALRHHENFDGSGYPGGLAGTEIPFEARILRLCDIYESLRSVRGYKAGMSHEQACAVILEGDRRTRPDMFDPNLLDLFRRHHLDFDRNFTGFAPSRPDRLPGPWAQGD